MLNIMVLFAVHANFSNHADTAELKQKLQICGTKIGVKRLRLVGYQVVFDAVTTDVPNHIIVEFKNPDFLSTEVHVASPPTQNGTHYPHTYGLPLPCGSGFNTIHVGLTGIDFETSMVIDKNFDININSYDPDPAGSGRIIPMKRLHEWNEGNAKKIKLEHVILFFSY